VDRLRNKVVVITGAAQGIGQVYASALAREGAAVAVCDLQSDKARAVAASLVDQGHNAKAYVVDIRQESSVVNLMTEVAGEYGGIDGLINNASVYAGLEYVDPLEIDIQDWDRVIEVNLRGVWLCTKHVVPYMRARGGGSIVNQSSIGAWTGQSLMHYSVAKAGVNSMTTLFSRALGADNITVNAIAPGQINTSATMDHKSAEAVQSMIDAQSLHRLGTPEDLAGAAIYLCSDESRFTTGQILVIDGGFLPR